MATQQPINNNQQATPQAAALNPTANAQQQTAGVPQAKVPTVVGTALAQQQANLMGGQGLAVAAEQARQSIQPQAYTAQANDTLQSIAAQFDVPESAVEVERPGNAGLAAGDRVQINGMAGPQRAGDVSPVPEMKLSIKANMEPYSGNITQAVATHARFTTRLEEQEKVYREQLAKQEAEEAEAKKAEPKSYLQKLLS